MDKIDIAMEEIKILQSIIARHDDLSIRIKSWCISLNIGLIAAFYGINASNQISFNKISMVIILVLLTGFFLWLDTIYRVAMDRAIQRTTEIETEIREHKLSTYPKINISLGMPNRLTNQIRTIRNIRMNTPYIMIIIIDTVAIFIK